MEVWMRASVLCVLSLVCACLGGCQRHQSSDLKTKTKTKSTKQTFLWKATHEQYRGSELYIYGYIHPHLLPTGHLDQAIRKAFHSTKRILVEADYQNPRNRQYRETYIQRYGLLPPGSQMHQRLGRKTLRAYLKVCQDMGVSPSFMSRYRPWLAGLALNAFGFELLGYTRSAPLAPSLVEMARQSQRQKLSPILSVKQDLLTYAELSGKGQEAILLFYTLQMLQWRQATKLKKLQEAYKKGDLWGVERAMFGAIDKYPTQATHIRKLTSDRNIKLTQALKSLIASKDARYFAIVDIIQLPGQMGLLSLLKNEGFVLKRVARVGQSDASPQPKRPPVGSDWYTFQDTSYGMSARMPEKPRLHDSVQVYLGGSIATRSYTWQKPTFATELVGYRYPVHMSVALRKARIRHKYIRTILDKIVQKHNATIRKENYEATFAGQKAAYFQLKNGSQLEDHYIVYFDGQMIHAAVVYVGRVAKNDRRLKMGQAFFRSVKLIKVPRR